MRDQVRGSTKYLFREGWRHSLWLLWMLSLGVFNWVGFLYGGARARVNPVGSDGDFSTPRPSPS